MPPCRRLSPHGGHIRASGPSCYGPGKIKRPSLGDNVKSRLSLCVAAAFLATSTGLAAQPANTDYRYPGSDAGATRYSPLTQINAKNVGRLKQAWRYDLKPDSQLQNTPIVVNGVLYGVGSGKVVALDAATGAEKWVYTPELPQKSRTGFFDRGESWWSDGKQSRLLVTASNFVYSLDPATGKPDPAFGSNVRIDLNDNLRGPASENYVRMGGAVNVYRDMFFTCGEGAAQTPVSPR